MAMSSW